METGIFNINDYLERLNEEAEAKSVEKSSTEGIIIPDENKKSFDWLKKEYQKGKTEVKVEMKMGGQKFEPSMNLQTSLKSVNTFKSGMFGDVKTSDTGGGKSNEGGESSGTSKPESNFSQGEKKGSSVKKAEASEKETTEVKKAEVKEKEEDKKKKISEGVYVIKESYSISKDQKRELAQLPLSIHPDINNIVYCRKMKQEYISESVIEGLPVATFDNYEIFLNEWSGNFPIKEFFIAKVLEDNSSFLVDPDNENNAKYIVELI